MAQEVRLIGVPVRRWREAAERVYGGAGYSILTWRTEIAAYTALLNEDAEPDVVNYVSGMACGLQEYVEQRAEV